MNAPCAAQEKGGELGYLTRGKVSREFAEVSAAASAAAAPSMLAPLKALTPSPLYGQVIFNEEPGHCYGPIRTEGGLHLLYVHSCREPEGGEPTFPEWMQVMGLGKG